MNKKIKVKASTGSTNPSELRKPIRIRSSNSPLGGGSVRVYVGDKLVWTKRVKTVSELMLVNQHVEILVLLLKSKEHKSYRKLVRLV